MPPTVREKMSRRVVVDNVRLRYQPAGNGKILTPVSVLQPVNKTGNEICDENSRDELGDDFEDHTGYDPAITGAHRPIDRNVVAMHGINGAIGRRSQSQQLPMVHEETSVQDSALLRYRCADFESWLCGVPATSTLLSKG